VGIRNGLTTKDETERPEPMAESTDTEGLRAVFMDYCTFGDKSNLGQMTSKSFFKLAKDSQIVDKKSVTEADVDIIFTKIKGKSGRTIPFPTFLVGLEQLAKKKYAKDESSVAVAKIHDAIKKQGGPVSSGTQPDAVKFHDDKSTYTGVHANGGPSTNDSPITLMTLMDRTQSDARGRKL